MKRIASVVVLAALLLSGGAVSAQAAPSDVVTIQGHVRDDDGDPVKGIRVSGGCQCGFEGPAPAYSGTTVTTNSDGFFSFKLRREYASYISFADPKDRYLTGTARLKKRGPATYTGNKTLDLASEVAGTIRDDNGNPAKFVEVKFYDADSGKRVREQGKSQTDKNGRFHALVPGGSYKVRLSAVNDNFISEWYGESPTRAGSPVVTVKAGGKTAGINGTLTKQLRIVGQVRLAGTNQIYGNGDRIALRVRDSLGTVLSDDFTDGLFFAEKLQPGTYTLEFYPTGSNFFVPQTLTYTLAPDQVLEHEKVTLTPVPASATDKRSAVFGWGSVDGTATKGKLFTAVFFVQGYGDESGGTVTFYAGSTKIDTATVGAKGKVELRSRFSNVSTGDKVLTLEFSGTETTLPTKLKTPITVRVKR